MQKKQLFFVMPSAKTGGGSRVIFSLAAELQHKEFDISIVLPNNSDQANTFTIKEEIKVIKIGKSSSSNLVKAVNYLSVYFFIFKSLVRLKKDAIIIFTDPIQSLFIPYLPKKKQIIRYVQSDDYKIFDDLSLLRHPYILNAYKYMCKRSFSGKCQYIFNSRFTYERFCAVSQRKDVACYLVHPALNHLNFVNYHQPRSNLYLKISLAIIARKHPLKGFSDFLRAWSVITDSVKSQIENVFILTHDALDLSELPKKFQVIHPKSDLEITKYFNYASIFVSTSWWEGFGLPPLEAMACGCAVITSKSGGANEYAVENQNCLMYLPKDWESLGKKIGELICNKSLRDELSTNGQKTSLNFNWGKSSLQLINFIRGLAI